MPEPVSRLSTKQVLDLVLGPPILILSHLWNQPLGKDQEQYEKFADNDIQIKSTKEGPREMGLCLVMSQNSGNFNCSSSNVNMK